MKNKPVAKTNADSETFEKVYNILLHAGIEPEEAIERTSRYWLRDNQLGEDAADALMVIDSEQLEKMRYFSDDLTGKFEITLDQILHEALDTWLESAGSARLEVQTKREKAAMASAGNC